VTSDADYLRHERRIATDETDSIIARWTWGRQILLDNERMSPTGKSLRHGVADNLIAKATRRGHKLSRQEIERRLQAGRTYPTMVQIREALTNFESWDALARAGFPPVDRPDGEADFDPRSDTEAAAGNARQGRRLLASIGVGQQSFDLWPEDRFGDDSPLAEMAKYVEEQAAITARFAARDDRLLNHFQLLLDAADGDLTVTWGAAEELLQNGDPS